jgi:hypothetical protein
LLCAWREVLILRQHQINGMLQHNLKKSPPGTLDQPGQKKIQDSNVSEMFHKSQAVFGTINVSEMFQNTIT